MKILPIETQEKIDIAMAYFHPDEKIFSIERQEKHMLDALTILSKTLGHDHKEVTLLRGAWFARDKQRMYNILDKYVTL